MEILSLQQFKKLFSAQISNGTWVLEYHDRTHLSEGTYLCIGEFKIEECVPAGNYLFKFYPKSETDLSECLNDAWKSENKNNVEKQLPKATRTILDQIRESMVRVGLLQPSFEMENTDLILKRKFAIIVLDTNALRNGSVRHLQEQFPKAKLWIIIPTVALMEIGEKAANVKNFDNAKIRPDNIAIIRNRPQVTIIPQAVEWIKSVFPTEILELPPELLRTFRGYEPYKNNPDKEPDRISINDRLILEGIKNLRRQRNLSENVYLMSGDKDISWLARLEGIQTIFPVMPDIQDILDGVYSIRYSLESQKHVVCSIHRFLWDLTHTFSKVRIRQCENDTENNVELSYYFTNRLVNDWIDDKLEVTSNGSCFTSETA